MKKILLFLFIIITSQLSFSQTYKGTDAKKYADGAELVRFKEHSKIPVHIRFDKNFNLNIDKALDYTKTYIKTSNSDFVLKDIQKSKDNDLTYRYYQTLSNYPIEFSAWNIHLKDDKVVALNGEIFDTPEASVIFSISEEEALNTALNYINAQSYMWQNEKQESLLKEFKEDVNATYYPKGEKVIVPNKIKFTGSELRTAYKFNIFSLKPYDRKMVYVDAQTGDILFDLKLIRNSNEVGTAHTQYSGVQQINTEYNGTHYILKDNTRGQGIRTFDCNDSNNYDSAVEFTDNDNVWNNVNQYLDEYATDAHFATIKTYDYFKDIHDRNSIDALGHKLWSYVHFSLIDEGYWDNVNAFWNGEWMTYGDGSAYQGITPLTTVDICGHEITHGLTENTADLIYWGESGALNEAFSDIFGTAIEFYATPEYADWLCGEDIGEAFRSLINPKQFQQPDTYQGEHWEFTDYDYGGVHINSGVLNYWFYLVSEGGSGTNDYGNSYNVNGIGILKAEQIAFRILVHYLTNSSDFSDAYYYGIQAALDIYGECSSEVKAVGDAFYAVGLADAPYPNDNLDISFYASETTNCTFPFEVQFYYNGTSTGTFLWEFGDGTTTNLPSPTHTYNEAGYFNVKLTIENSCGIGYEEKENYIVIDENLLCETIMNTNGETMIEGCHGIIYDPGGVENNYPSGVNSTLTIHSPGASRIVLNILEFDIEAGSQNSCNYDYIGFYDGASSSDQLIGNTTYCNTTGNPGTITSTGEYITIKFFTDGSVTREGFKIQYSCINDNGEPIVDFVADNTTSCDGLINFTDISTNSPTSWNWHFGDGNSSTEQNPTYQYINNGIYNVKLIATNELGSNSVIKSDYIVINMPQISNRYDNFEVCINEEFQLNLDFTEEVYWYENKQDEQPVYIGNVWNHSPINTNTTYYIREIIGTCKSTFATIKIIPISCEELSPGFSSDKTNSCNGIISFTDNSIGHINSWEWDFGDGTTSNEQNPIHHYLSNGTYTVKLTISNNTVSDYIEKTNYITVEMPYIDPIDEIIVCLNEDYEINFEDFTGIAYWYNNTEDEMPVHTGNIWNIPNIDSEKIYYVREVSNFDIPENEVCMSNFIEVKLVPVDCSIPPVCNFISNRQSTCSGIIIFNDISEGYVETWNWDFGDGNTSNQRNPIHHYLQNGIYSVTLRVSNTLGDDIEIKTDYITVNMPEMTPLNNIRGCYDSSFEIRIQREGIIYWYNDTEDIAPVYTGNNWTHNAIPENKIYYVREVFAPENPEDETCMSNFTTATITSSRCINSVENNEFENISIAPNPNNGTFKIFVLDNISEYNIFISDISGKIILSKKYQDNTINLTNYPEGTYFIKISNDKQQKIIRFIIQK